MLRQAIFVGLLCAAISLTGTSRAHAAKGPDLTPLQLQAIQQHEFEADKAPAFASVVDVLQDLGFTISSADLNTGFITAESPVTNSRTYSWGGSSGSTRVTAFIETMASGRTRVRLSFVARKNSFGWATVREPHDTAVTDPRVYQVAFEKVDEALFVRRSTNTSAPNRASSPAPPSTVSVPH